MSCSFTGVWLFWRKSNGNHGQVSLVFYYCDILNFLFWLFSVDSLLRAEACWNSSIHFTYAVRPKPLHQALKQESTNWQPDVMRDTGTFSSTYVFDCKQLANPVSPSHNVIKLIATLGLIPVCAVFELDVLHTGDEIQHRLRLSANTKSTAKNYPVTYFASESKKQLSSILFMNIDCKPCLSRSSTHVLT